MPKQTAVAPAHIACVGLGWFPKTPGGLDRYVYELTYHLAAAQIALVLSDMDSAISLLESRQAKTKAIKQGMMQELLTGRTRLI